MKQVWRIAGIVVWSACAPASEPALEPDAVQPSGVSESGLAASLEAQVRKDSIHFGLHVTNVTGEAVAVEFPTAQRADFVVMAEEGREVWRSSADQMFAQVVTVDTIGAGETVDYRAAWGWSGQSGDYRVVGRLTSSNKPIELRTTLELPAR